MSAATAITETMAMSAMAIIGMIWPCSPCRLPARTGAAGTAKLRRWAVIPFSFRGHVPLERVWRVLGLATHGTVQGPCRHEGAATHQGRRATVRRRNVGAVQGCRARRHAL